jgi:AraC-like DNA-binding protein
LNIARDTIEWTSAARLSVLDSRRLARADQFDAFRRWVATSGLGAKVDMSPTEGHIVVGATLLGRHNVVSVSEIEDPSVTYFPAVDATQAPLGLRLFVDGGDVEEVIAGRPALTPGGMPVVVGNREPLRRRVKERGWSCAVQVARPDLLLTDSEVERALSGGAKWEEWHTKLLMQACGLARQVARAADTPKDATGVDRYVAGVVELILRSALGLAPDARPSPAQRREFAERFILSRLGEQVLTPELIAAEQGISVRQLSRAFRDGEGIAATIARVRVQHADGLLRDPRNAALSVSAIAHRCGYTSSAHFSRVYKGHYGVAPSETRPRETGPTAAIAV